MSNSFVNTGIIKISLLTEKTEPILIQVLNTLNGLSVSEAENVLKSALDEIKNCSTVNSNLLS